MIVAIDGTAGSGKSTLTAKLSKYFDLVNINSGNLYRAISYALVDSGYTDYNEDNLKKLLDENIFEYVDSEHVRVNSSIVNSSLLHNDKVDRVSNIIASFILVRKCVNSILNEFARGKNIICEGRDICSVVFPNADLKFYIDADFDVRAKRRAAQYNDDLNNVRQSLKERDYGDKNRPFGALVRVDDSVFLDTSSLSIDDVFEKMKTVIQSYINNAKSK